MSSAPFVVSTPESPSSNTCLHPVTERHGTRTRCKTCGIDHFDHKNDADAKGYGGKTISFWGSVCLNLNNNTGPAMVILPLLNQQCGWFLPTFATLVVFIFSSFACTMLCEAMQRIPGNRNYAHRYEFATLVQHYYGKKWYVVFQVVYNFSLQASNIAAMIISAQAIDQFIEHVAGHSYALDYQQWPFKFIKSSGSADVPWCTGYVLDDKCHGGKELTFVISLGFLICMTICIPFGYLNLDENMWFQWFSFFGMIFFTLEFCTQFLINFDKEDKVCLSGMNYNNMTCNYERHNHVGNYSNNGFHRTPFFVSSTAGLSNILGVSVFSFAYVVTIPSWVNEKMHYVDVNKGIWIPAVMGLILKLMLGLMGAWAFILVLPDGSQRDNADDILDILFLDYVPWYTQYSAYLWDLTSLIPGIPVLAIMVRYNLLSGNVCGRMPSFFWGVVAPWIVTAFCYEADILVEFCNWVSLVMLGFVNFVVPVMLYRTSLMKYPDFEEQMGLDPVPTPLFYSKAGITGSYSPIRRLSSSSSLLKNGNIQEEIIDTESNYEEEHTPLLPSTDMISSTSSRDRKLRFDTPDSRVSSTLSRLDSRMSILSDTPPDDQEGYVNAIPRWFTVFGRLVVVNRILFANVMIVFFSTITIGNIIVSIYGAATNQS